MMKKQNQAGLENNLEQIGQFFSEWEQLHSAPITENNFSDWQKFFTQWENLPLAETTIKQLSAWSTGDCNNFESFATAFTQQFQAYRQSGVMTNIWRVAGIDHDELKNSQVLAWMLDRFGDHGQQSAILELLIKEIGKQPKWKELANSIGEKVKYNYWTRLESLPLGSLESRIDIEIESPDFLIFIEVKIYAGETGDQLKRYVDLTKSKGVGRESIVVFLTPSGKMPNDKSLHDSVVPISWKQIANILDAYIESLERTGFIHQVFHQFAAHARQHS